MLHYSLSRRYSLGLNKRILILIISSLFICWQVIILNFMESRNELFQKDETTLRLHSHFINIELLLQLLNIMDEKDLDSLNENLWLESITSEIIDEVLPFVIAPPLVPINQSCRPIDAPIVCPNEEQLLNSSRKVGVLLQFGFDADTLEIHLNQLGDIVDQFFIVESTRSHFRAMDKVLIWERIKNQQRFSEFKGKITHIILDDSDTSLVRTNMINDDESKWELETLQERYRWESFLQWNKATEMFNDDDILGFGDTDEIPSRSAILSLKHCTIRINPVDIGIWFPYGNINQAFASDWPVPEHNFTLGDPSYWSLSNAKQFVQLTDSFPGRNRGRSLAYLLGGMHMTHYGYLPFNIIKRLTQTESSRSYIRYALETLLQELTNSNKSYKERIRRLEETFSEEIPEDIKTRIYPLELLRKEPNFKINEIAILPWFYDCNRNRYPAWEGKHDTRLDIL